AFKLFQAALKAKNADKASESLESMKSALLAYRYSRARLHTDSKVCMCLSCPSPPFLLLCSRACV
ncbi:MAG: hypothetical protein ACPIOQ_47845, partial [Promethearchaeia archaeon]